MTKEIVGSSFLKEQILAATIKSGQLTPEQIATFRTDKDAWKKQMRVIWEDLNAKEL